MKAKRRAEEPVFGASVMLPTPQCVEIPGAGALGFLGEGRGN